jgi:hypothetical protein
MMKSLFAKNVPRVALGVSGTDKKFNDVISGSAPHHEQSLRWRLLITVENQCHNCEPVMTKIDLIKANIEAEQSPPEGDIRDGKRTVQWCGKSWRMHADSYGLPWDDSAGVSSSLRSRKNYA